MRIATSSIYNQQIANIDNITVNQTHLGNELSTGKALNFPSDDPTDIAQDLSTRTDLTVENQLSNNFTNTTNQLNTVDGSLNTLTSVLQSVRALAVQSASDTNTPQQQAEIAKQVDQQLNEIVGLANTEYGGKYVFSGSSNKTVPPVTTTGSPVSAVTSSGNEVAETQALPNGQQLTTTVTLQQAFNYNAPNGSPDAFQTLINLRNTLNNQQVVDESAQQVNVPGTAIVPATTTVAQLSTGAPTQVMKTPLTPDSSGNISISISSGSAPNGVTVTFLPTDTMANVITKINAATAQTGVTASFNAQTQRLSLTSNTNQPFQVNDTPSAGAANTGNFVSAFGLTQQADVTNNISRQIGDIDNVLNQVLTTRAQVGATLQTVSSVSSTNDSQVLNNTKVQSALEDADIPKVVSQFSQAQTALQAAYGTTTRLESKSLFDYLG